MKNKIIEQRGVSLSIGALITTIVNDNTQDDVINIGQVAADFGCVIKPSFSDSINKAILQPANDGDHFANIAFNSDNTEAENNTLTALLLSNALLDLKSPKMRTSRCDIFFLSEMRKYRMSSQLMLATRLSIPESIIKKLDGLTFDAGTYAKRSNLMPNFVNSAIHISDGDSFFGLLNNLDIAVSSTSLRDKLGRNRIVQLDLTTEAISA